MLALLIMPRRGYRSVAKDAEKAFVPCRGTTGLGLDCVLSITRQCKI